MPQTRLLLLDAGQLSAHVWTGTVLRQEAAFDGGPESLARFSAYLRAHPRSLFYLLADVPDEGFHMDPIPYVQGKDRQSLVERRLAQYFYGSSLVTALSLGRERSGRRDERMLFMGLTRPQWFEPWLAAIEANEAQLAGIYSVPLLAGALADRLGLLKGQERLLLVTQGKGGLRQTYFENGRLRFSRLGPAGSSAEETARLTAAESAKLYQYLASQRILPRGSALTTVVLIHPSQRVAYAAACQPTSDLAFRFADVVHAGVACRLSQIPPDSSADILFLHLLARRPPREQFAGEPIRHLYRVWQWRFGLVGAGLVVLAACLLFAGKRLFDIHELQTHREATLAQARSDLGRYEAILAALPPMPTTLDNLRGVLARFDALQKRSSPIEATWAPISVALEESPQVALERIEWELSPEHGGAGEMHAVATVTGRLAPELARDQRRVLETIESFAAALRRGEDVRVAVTRLPFDVESGKSLRSTDASPAAPEAPRFAVRVARKL